MSTGTAIHNKYTTRCISRGLQITGYAKEQIFNISQRHLCKGWNEKADPMGPNVVLPTVVSIVVAKFLINSKKNE